MLKPAVDASASVRVTNARRRLACSRRGRASSLLAVTNDPTPRLVDTVDGLEILVHCRRRNLPIVDILYALEDRVRAAGYRGERLGLADFKSGDQLVYVFYDASRFKTFADLKLKVGLRISEASPAPSQPDA